MAFYELLGDQVEAVDLCVRLFNNFGVPNKTAISEKLAFVEKDIGSNLAEFNCQNWIFTFYGFKWVEGLLWPPDEPLWTVLPIWITGIQLEPLERSNFLYACVLFDFYKCTFHQTFMNNLILFYFFSIR